MFEFSSLPNPVKALLAVLTGTSIIGAISLLDPGLTGIVAVGMLILAALVGGFLMLQRVLERKKSNLLTGGIQQQAGAVPTGINDATGRKNLDDLRRSFEGGLEKFRNAGKDIYKLPWFMFVGEPGSGKTEAIRHSNVGFPPGLQDEMQGAGGTINMNWWFTNQAVFLDTAGRLMFEQVRPGDTSEWREFLQMLRRSRPNCPVNGLLLVIPADSLIRDTPEETSRKAGRIAQQLDTIQRTLDVRFPVFVLITKGDLLNGFREFFEEFNDLHTQNQMFGWSNPAERDEPFRPELVTQHIDSVIARIRKRRLGLLKDPVPRNTSGRRADEVDALFAFPQSLALIAPRLRHYLEQIFVAGEWSAKPLFLRGIYFTSAMREGRALDQELAQAVGCSLEMLPEGKAWERERACFLKDLFTEKVFPERNLVTRATNTKRMLRQRQGLLFGIGALALAGFLGFSLYQYSALQSSVGEHEQIWQGAAKDWTTAKWNPLLKANFNGGTEYRYLGDQPVESYRENRELRDKPLLSILERLQELAAAPIETGWVFRPLASLSSIKEDRVKAQQVVFNASVVSPVINAARQRMQNAETAPSAEPKKAAENLLIEAHAIAALLRLEMDALQKPDSFEGVPPYFSTLLEYSLSEKIKDVEQVSRLLTKNFERVPWPPVWAARSASSLASNPPIQKGLERLKNYADLSGTSYHKHLSKIQELLAALREFQAKEHDLNVKPTLESKSDPALLAEMVRLYEQLGEKRKHLDLKIKEVAEEGLLSSAADGPNSALAQSYARVVASGKSQSDDAFTLLQKTCSPRLGDDKNRLFADVDAALKKKRQEIAALLEQSLSPADVEALQKLDDAYLADSGDHKRRVYELRWDLYERSYQQLHLTKGNRDLIGTEWKEAGAVKTRLRDITALVRSNQEKLKEKFEACDFFLDLALRGGNDLIIDAYLAEVQRKVGPAVQFPLIWPPGARTLSPAQMKETGQLLRDVRKDIAAEWVQTLEPYQKDRLLKVPKQFAPLEAFRDSLLGPEGKSGTFTVTLINYKDQTDKASLAKWRAVVVNNRVQSTSVASNTEVGTFPADGDFTVVFKEYTDGTGSSRTVSGGGSWSLLKLLKQGGRAKPLDGGRRWQMPVAIGESSIVFEFAFDKPLPDLGSWPTKEAVGL